MFRTFLFVCLGLFIVGWLVGCSPAPTPTPMPTPVPTPTPSLDDAEAVGRDFLRAWQSGSYEHMYSLLSLTAQASIPSDKFVARYRAIAAEATMTGLTASIIGLQRLLTTTAQISFTLTMDTQLAGQFQVENELHLSHDGRHWGVDWSPSAIFPLLRADNLVYMFTHVPERGSIYDRQGLPLATQAALVEVGVVPERITDEAKLVSVLQTLFGFSDEQIKAKYAQAGRPDWFMPVGDLTPEQASANHELLSAVPGISWREKAVRSYPQGALAAHAVGYMAQIDPETLARLESRGYRSGDRLGVAGLEGWGETILAGTRGGTLAIIGSDGRIVLTLAQRPAQESSHIYTTLNSELQREVERILDQRVGAVVVQDVHDGEVLAMASYPSYNPGELTSGASAETWQALLNNPGRPFLDRATAGVYPPGSTFKIVTLVAGMEELGLVEGSSFYCAGRWDGLADGATRTCWLKTGHGALNLYNGFLQSCDSVFWEIGQALNDLEPHLLSIYARGFGLGAPTGLNALYEAAGLIPDPEWKASTYTGVEQQWLPRDAVNMAIGQGDVLATPLQMANLVAAVANGGTLYRPRLLRQSRSLADGAAQDYPSEALGRLPVSATVLQFVRRGMQGVTTYGTALRAFIGATIPMAGKSGTAEAPPYVSHAWFVGYAPSDSPQIAVAVVLEHGGEGGADAAPLFRQMVEAWAAAPK